MHELSIAKNIVEIVDRAASDAGAARVEAIHLRVGALTGVVPDALLFCFDLAAEGTLAAGARLEIQRAPAVIRCQRCVDDVALENTQLFACPRCGAPAGTLVSGRELLVTSIDVPDSDPEPNKEHAHGDAYA